MSIFDALNQACLSTFGTPVIYSSANGNVSLSGIVEEQESPDTFAGFRLKDRFMVLSVLSSDVETHGIAMQDTVIINGVSYQVLEMQATLSGMTALAIKRYS